VRRSRARCVPARRTWMLVCGVAGTSACLAFMCRVACRMSHRP
jgi:hypothetical protein